MSKIFTVTLPDIGEGVVEGEVLEWLKSPGDSLMQDEAVVSVMTDKATVELPAPYPGKLSKQYHPAGEIAIKDRPLYDIELEEELDLPQQKIVKEKVTHPPIERASAAPSSQVTKREPGTICATPPVRQLAKTLGVNIHEVTGTGKDGRVTTEDVRGFLSKQSGTAPQPKAPTPIPHFEGEILEPLIGIRRLAANKMTESKSLIPHFSFFDKANAKSLVQTREKLKAEAKIRKIHLTYVAFFIKALSLSLKKFPFVNASVDMTASKVVLHKPHNIGIAMKTEQGLIVPVLKEVNDKSLEEIAREFTILKEKARTNKLEPSDMKGSTITISNFGTEGGLWATPVINYPEVAILATAKIYPEAVVQGEKIAIRQTLNCSWSFDHRVIDGDRAAAFSHHFISLIEHPSRLF